MQINEALMLQILILRGEDVNLRKIALTWRREVRDKEDREEEMVVEQRCEVGDFMGDSDEGKSKKDGKRGRKGVA